MFQEGSTSRTLAGSGLENSAAILRPNEPDWVCTIEHPAFRTTRRYNFTLQLS